MSSAHETPNLQRACDPVVVSEPVAFQAVKSGLSAAVVWNRPQELHSAFSQKLGSAGSLLELAGAGAVSALTAYIMRCFRRRLRS